MKADWSSSAACPSNPSGGEHLVPVVADPAAGPAIPAAAGQTHRVGVGRSEERLSRGGAPVEQQPTTRAVREAESSDVHGLGVVRADDVSEAQVQTEATQGAQASGQPVDLHVPVHRLLADAAGRLALGIEAVGQVGDRLLEALRDGREVLLVAGDQRRVGLGGEVVGKVKRAGSQGVHVISSDLRSLHHGADSTCRRVPQPPASPASGSTSPRDPYVDNSTRTSRLPFPQILASASDSAARPGSCRKPPGALYVESGGELSHDDRMHDLLLVFPARRRRHDGAARISSRAVEVPFGCAARLQRVLGAQDIVPDGGRGSVTAVPGLVNQLTSRELEVLTMLAAGRSNQAIASQLVRRRTDAGIRRTLARCRCAGSPSARYRASRAWIQDRATP